MPRERRGGSGSRSRSRSRKRTHSKRPGCPDHSDPDRDRASRGRGQRDRSAREGRVRVYMGNVPFGCNESDVWSFLQKYADRSAILSVDLPLKSDGSGRHRGYATAAFASTFEADFAIRNAHGRALSDPSSSHSRTISVRCAQSTLPKSHQSGLGIKNLLPQKAYSLPHPAAPSR
jgi:RNA recognition motif-containing protein